MFTYNGKIARNLEEQVAYLTRKHEADKLIATFGIKIIGKVNTYEEIPEGDYDYGDTYLVGVDEVAWMWTPANTLIGENEDYFLEVGQISSQGPEGPQGPQGPQGETGERGSKWYVSIVPATDVAGQKDNDVWLDAFTGMVYVYNKDGGGWRSLYSIKGPGGPTGPTGATPVISNDGAQILATDPATGATYTVISTEALKGPKGDTGDVGGFINIGGVVTSTNLLPDPEVLGNRTIAYLVGSAVPYDLYIQVGDAESAEWLNTGPLNVSTLVSVGGQYVNLWDSDTKLDKNTTDLPAQGYNYQKVYGVDENGNQVNLLVSSAATPLALVKRIGYGNIPLPSDLTKIAAAESNTAISKAYLDYVLNNNPKGWQNADNVWATLQNHIALYRHNIRLKVFSDLATGDYFLIYVTLYTMNNYPYTTYADIFRDIRGTTGEHAPRTMIYHNATTGTEVIRTLSTVFHESLIYGYADNTLVTEAQVSLAVTDTWLAEIVDEVERMPTFDNRVSE